MGKVEARDGDVFAEDVVPNVQLCPVVERENARVLSRLVLAVVQVPKLRALVLGVPLTEVVTVAKEALLGPGLFFVPPCSTESSIELMGLNRGDEGWSLDAVPGGIEPPGKLDLKSSMSVPYCTVMYFH